MCHFQVPLATGTYWNILQTTLTLCLLLQSNLKNVLFPYITLHSNFHSVLLGLCSEISFVLHFYEIFLKSVAKYRFIFMPFFLPFFQVRSTVNRIKERRKALNFSVCNLFSYKCVYLQVHPYSSHTLNLSLWVVCVRRTTGVTNPIFFKDLASHRIKKKCYSACSDESWPQSSIW